MTKTMRARRDLVPAVALALLAACSTADKPKPPAVAPSVVQSPEQKFVTVSNEQSGAGIVLEPAQELVVRLAIDATAGREWSLVDLKPGVLGVLGSKFERALRNTNTEESAGSVVWRFKPQAPGSVALKFDLRRPHSLEPAAQTVSFAVTVK